MRLFFAATSALLLSSSAIAQDATSDDSVITSVSIEDIRKIIESAGYNVGDPIEGGVAWTASDADDLKFAVQGTVCDDDKRCSGVHVIIVINDVGTAEFANEINNEYAAIKATADEDSDLILSRYLILDAGQTVANIQHSIEIALLITKAIAEDFDEATGTIARSSVSSIDWGDDSGSYANDGACDDARFHDDGDSWTYKRQHVLADASDCRAAFTNGLIKLELDFGNNSGAYANDDTCDDNRFSGSGRSVLTTDSHIKRDAVDCIAAYRAGTISR